MDWNEILGRLTVTRLSKLAAKKLGLTKVQRKSDSTDEPPPAVIRRQSEESRRQPEESRRQPEAKREPRDTQRSGPATAPVQTRAAAATASKRDLSPAQPIAASSETNEVPSAILGGFAFEALCAHETAVALQAEIDQTPGLSRPMARKAR